MRYFLLSFLIIILAVFVFSPFIVKAADFCGSGSADFYKSGIVPCGRNCDNPETTMVDETKPCTLCHFIVGFWNLINYGFKIMVFLALACLVVAGIMYITSAGSEKMTETAKTFIKQILFGFAIVLLGWVFIFTVMNYFAVKQPDLGIGKTEGWTKFTCSTESTGAYQGSFSGGGGSQQRLCSNTPGGKCKSSCDTNTENSWSAYKCTSGVCCIPKNVGQVQCGSVSGVDTMCVSQSTGCPSPNLEPYLANCGPQMVCCKVTFNSPKCGNSDGRCFKCMGPLGCADTHLCPDNWTRKLTGTNCPSGYACCIPE